MYLKSIIPLALIATAATAVPVTKRFNLSIANMRHPGQLTEGSPMHKGLADGSLHYASDLTVKVARVDRSKGDICSQGDKGVLSSAEYVVRYDVPMSGLSFDVVWIGADTGPGVGVLDIIGPGANGDDCAGAVIKSVEMPRRGCVPVPEGATCLHYWLKSE